VFIAAVRSLATYLAVSLYVLIAAPLGMALAILFGAKNFLYFLGHCGVRLALGLSGIKYRVAGAEHIPRDRAVVFCSNHQSNVDPPVLFEALHPRTHILYKAELNALPLLARAFRVGGFIPVDRRNKEAALRSIEAGAASLRAGNSFLIFPEGTRSRTAELLPFKNAPFGLAIAAGVPVVPVYVHNSFQILPKGGVRLHPRPIRVLIGEPIATAGLSLDHRQLLAERTRAALLALRARVDSGDGSR